MAKVLMKPQMSVVHMAISPVSKLTSVYSPNVFIHGIPWKVEACRDEDEDEDVDSLAVYLRCEMKDKTSNWAVPARATVKLLPFSSHNKNELVEHISPNVFTSSDKCLGRRDVINWDELLKDENQYVKNDTIQLKVEITAEDPNYADRSILKFETIDKCCDHGSHSTFRLAVENIENLIAVRSPQFTLRGLPWILTVFNSQSSYLGIKLSNKSTDDVSCDIEMSVKLLSSKHSIEKSDSDEKTDYLRIGRIVPWDDLLKSRFGYVEKNAITLMVKLKMDKPDGDVPDAGPSSAAAKRHRLECSICLEDIDGQDTSSTSPCGHIFCTACIKKAVEGRKVCPMCSATVKNLQRVFLPVSK